MSKAANFQNINSKVIALKKNINKNLIILKNSLLVIMEPFLFTSTKISFSILPHILEQVLDQKPWKSLSK